MTRRYGIIYGTPIKAGYFPLLGPAWLARSSADDATAWEGTPMRVLPASTHALRLGRDPSLPNKPRQGRTGFTRPGRSHRPGPGRNECSIPGPRVGQTRLGSFVMKRPHLGAGGRGEWTSRGGRGIQSVSSDII